MMTSALAYRHVLDAPQSSASKRKVPKGDHFTPAEPDENRPLKIWLLHGSFTGGHASAANSVKEAILLKAPDAQVEVINHAALSKNPRPVSTAAERALSDGKLSQAVREWGFEQNFEGNPLLHLASRWSIAYESIFSGDLLKRIHNEKPDILVATQAPTTDLLSYWRERKLIDQPLHAVVTDFAAHQIWSQDAVDQYYVASEAAKKDLVRFGVQKDRIEPTGIPIRPSFSRGPQDRAEMKKQLGLDPNKPFVLVMGGAGGTADFNGMTHALDALPNDFQAAVICGRNEKAQKALEQDTFTHDVRSLGFITNVVDYIDACDLIVSKPGGLSSSEILARGRPILIIAPIPGLEVQNARRLSAAGVGVWAKDMDDMVVQAGKLLADPKAREQMEQAALKMGKPNSASAAATEIIAAAWDHRLLSTVRKDGAI